MSPGADRHWVDREAMHSLPTGILRYSPLTSEAAPHKHGGDQRAEILRDTTDYISRYGATEELSAGGR